MREKVFDYIKQRDVVTPKEVAIALDMNVDVVVDIVKDLMRSGILHTMSE